MKKTVVISVLMAIASIANAVPVEQGADLYKPITRETAAFLGDTVKASGYRCDSVSGALSTGGGTTYRVNCNGYRYTYEIKDVGGTWKIFVK